MARFLPLRGVRYDLRRPDREALLAPPYDVISPSQRAELARHRDNLVHAELPVEEPGAADRYEAAARHLAAWCETGVLRRDPEPVLYAYAQRFQHGGRALERHGAFGLLELAPPGAESGIHPHETTLHGPREDRRRLLEATGANLSPLFFLTPDDDGALAGGLAEITRTRPLGEVTTPWGTEEQLWAWSGVAARRAARTIAAAPIVFADGHHRFASARAYAVNDRGADPNGTRGYVLAVVVPMRDPGLLVLPTHRLLKRAAGLDPTALDAALEPAFDAVELPTAGRQPEVRAAALEAWIEARHREGRPAFVLSALGRADRGLVPRAESLAGLYAGSGVDARQQALEVQLVQALLQRAYGLDVEAVARREALAYSHDAAEMLRLLESAGSAAFVLPATPVEAVVRVASAGLLLPQKSTYFLPKLTSGCVLHVHERPADPWRGAVWGRTSREVAADWLEPHAAPDVTTSP